VFSWVFNEFKTLKKGLKTRLVKGKKKPLSWRCKHGENLVEIYREFNEGNDCGRKKIFQSDQNQCSLS